jgi:hypothetical protein
MRLFWRMSIGLVCVAVAAYRKAPELRSGRSEGRPDSAVAFIRSDSLLLFSAKIPMPAPWTLDWSRSTAFSATRYPHPPLHRLPESFGAHTPLAGEQTQLLNYLTDDALVVSGGALPPCPAFVYERQQPGQPAS